MRKEDLSGMRFGRLIAVSRSENRGKNGKTTYWLCKCDCGNTREIMASGLKVGDSRSCGCLRRDGLFKDIKGKRFGRLLVLDLASNATGGDVSKWRCKCDCGTVKVIAGNSLASGKTQSCGCLQKETIAQQAIKSEEQLEASAFKRYLRGIWLMKRTTKRRSLLPITITEIDLKEQ